MDGGYQSTDVGWFTLSIDGPCMTDCVGRECGPDGCGGGCGTCVGGYCDMAGQCQPQMEGDVCEVPFVVGALPFTFDGDTSAFNDDYRMSAGNSCPGPWNFGEASDDVVFQFTAPATDTYRFSLPVTDFDVAIWVATMCGEWWEMDDVCVASRDDAWLIGGEWVDVTMNVGETVYIVVDGHSNSVNDAGTFTFQADLAP